MQFGSSLTLTLYSLPFFVKPNLRLDYFNVKTYSKNHHTQFLTARCQVSAMGQIFTLEVQNTVLPTILIIRIRKLLKKLLKSENCLYWIQATFGISNFLMIENFYLETLKNQALLLIKCSSKLKFLLLKIVQIRDFHTQKMAKPKIRTILRY